MFGKHAQNLARGNRRLIFVDPVHIDGIGLQPLQTLSYVSADIRGIHAGNAGVEIGMCAFGSDGDLLLHPRFREPFTYDLFAVAVTAVVAAGVPRTVDVGGVEERAPEFGEPVEKPERSGW